MGKTASAEVEVKLRVNDLAVLGRRLRQLGAKRQSRVHEQNTLFDTADKALMRSGRLLRLRWNDSQAVLTFKKPPSRSRRKDSPYKVREEIEFSVLQPPKLMAVLTQLGFVAGFRYEKVRTTYALKNFGSLKIEVDETPIGVFVELEGTRRGIDRAAGLLGYGREQYITANYFTLFREWCRQKGIAPGDMIFRSRKRGRRKQA